MTFVVVVDLLSLELLDFRLIIAYFGTLRIHQIAPFFPHFFPEGADPPPPEHKCQSTSLQGYIRTLSLVN